MLGREDERDGVFRIEKQIACRGGDVTESGCIGGKDGGIVTGEIKMGETWREYFDRLLGEGFVWDTGGLSGEGAVCGPGESVAFEDVGLAVGGVERLGRLA